MTFALFALAAGLGVVVRVAATATVPRPLGTLAVNVVGSSALGALAASGPSAATATVLGVAGLGTLTTVSSAAVDAQWLAGERGRAAAGVYVAVMVGATVGAAWLGLAALS